MYAYSHSNRICPLQELNNPILYLDVMGWCWQADYRNRPSASVLEKVLANPSFSRLVDAVPLSPTCQVTASCICTLPLAIVAQDVGGDENHNKPPYVADADLQVDGAKSCNTADHFISHSFQLCTCSVTYNPRLIKDL